MLKAIERHRERYDEVARSHPFMREMMEELEAELAERYVEVPADANGELCRCGDEVSLTEEDERLMVCGYTVAEDGFVSLYASKLADGRKWFPTIMTYASEVEHSRKPTVEKVLGEHRYRVYEVLLEYSNLVRSGAHCGEGEYLDKLDAIDAEFAERVREAVRAE